MNPATPIETDRLALFALEPGHSDLLFSMLSDSDHTRYLSLPTATCPQAVRQMTEGMLLRAGNCLWLIKEKQTSAFVGMCGFLRDSSVPNFVYSIAEDQKGKGFACEAATAAMAAGRRLLGLDRVELNIHSGNDRSLRVAEKLGFTKTGEYRHVYPQEPGPVMVFVFHKSYSPVEGASSR